VVELLDKFAMTELREQDLEDDDLLECYLDAMKVQNRSKLTINRYEYIIRNVMKAVKVPTRRINVYHLRNYIAKEQARGLKDSTLEGIRQVISAYFNWLQREALIEKNPTANLGAIKCEKKKKKRYTDIEMAKLVLSCESKRDLAIVHFLSSTGCRVSEMTGLNRDDVNLEKLQCIVHGKGNKERVVFMSDVAGDAIREYLAGRTDGNEALFVGRCKERLQPGGVRFMLNAIAEKAGVEHVHPHKFRRTRATELTRRGMPIQEVAKILGHEKIDTTMRYLDIDNEQLSSDFRRFA
jgi:site-specific recombinase XerD